MYELVPAVAEGMLKGRRARMGWLMDGQIDNTWWLVRRGEHAWPVVNVLNSALISLMRLSLLLWLMS